MRESRTDGDDTWSERDEARDIQEDGHFNTKSPVLFTHSFPLILSKTA